jgi:putative aldouronate transport system permease protein
MATLRVKTVADHQDGNIVSGIATFTQKVVKDFKKNKSLYLLVLPVLLFYILFCYKPMYGAIIAFKNFIPSKGIMGSSWVGLKYFYEFFNSFYFLRVLKNTLVISITTIVFGFPAPIILALLINELRSKMFSRVVQTISYMPHFISLVVICGMIIDFTRDTGIVNEFLGVFGLPKETMLNYPGYFVPVYVISDIWQGVGWGSIIYLAALMGIDNEQYEAATIDGASRWKQAFHITIPGIIPTIVIMLILRMGNIMNVGFEKIILLYNPAIYETSDVISSFVYRKGLQEFNWGYSSAVGLFNSVINFIFLITANWLSKKSTDSSLW